MTIRTVHVHKILDNGAQAYLYNKRMYKRNAFITYAWYSDDFRTNLSFVQRRIVGDRFEFRLKMIPAHYSDRLRNFEIAFNSFQVRLLWKMIEEVDVMDKTMVQSYW